MTAAEAARKGVRINAICPGPVTETKMSKELGQTLAKRLGVPAEEQLAGFLNCVLARTRGKPRTKLQTRLFSFARINRAQSLGRL